MSSRHSSPVQVSGPKLDPKRMCIAGLGFIRSAPAASMMRNTATLMAMIARRHVGALAEQRHDLAEALVRDLVFDELRRFLLWQHRPDGFRILVRSSPDDYVVLAVYAYG